VSRIHASGAVAGAVAPTRSRACDTARAGAGKDWRGREVFDSPDDLLAKVAGVVDQPAASAGLTFPHPTPDMGVAAPLSQGEAALPCPMRVTTMQPAARRLSAPRNDLWGQLYLFSP
jgi:hypothetical protein